MTTLDQEKFNTAKELAEISGNLSTARAELKKLEETTGEYMIGREKEAEERVLKVLRESREALEEVSKNHKEITIFSGETKAYAATLKTIANEIIALFEDFTARMHKADEDMAEHQKALTETLNLIKVERVQVQEDRKLLEADRKDLEDGFRLLKDKRDVLDRAWSELEKKKLEAKN